MRARDHFLQELAKGIIFAGGTTRFSEESALMLARGVWDQLQELGTDTFPSMVELEELRFVYQWDESPALVTVMVWDDVMWRDMARIEVRNTKG